MRHPARLLLLALTVGCTTPPADDDDDSGTGSSGVASGTGASSSAVGASSAAGSLSSSGSSGSGGSSGTSTASGGLPAHCTTPPVPATGPAALDWVCVYGDGADQRFNTLRADGAGGALWAGHGSGQFGVGGTSTTEVATAAIADIVWGRVEASGFGRWSRRPAEGGASPWPPDALGLTTVGALLYVAGAFEGTADLGQLPVTATGARDLFIASYLLDGAPQWSRTYHSEAGDRVIDGRAIAVDGTGAMYVGGSFRGRMDLGLGPLQRVGANDDEAFLAKWSAAGTIQWNKRWGTGGAQVIHALAAHPLGGVSLTGVIENQVDLTGTLMGATNGAPTALVARVAAGGSPTWARALGTGAPGLHGAWAVAIDGDGATWVGGAVDGTVDFGDGAGAAPASGFVARYAEDGTLLCKRRFTGDGTPRVTALAVAGQNSVVAGGRVESPAGAAATTVRAFVHRYDAACAPVWERTWGAAGQRVGVDGVAVDATHLFVAGTLWSAGVTVDGAALGHAGGQDAWLARFTL
ncbi:MAG: hypothetical protein HY904_17300 [Deltaproteobacteria bacterium]|nr:hypothetical protein [Deltaproteobacteria bacterium]